MITVSDIKKFDMNSMNVNSSCYILGKKNSGKTLLVKSILKHHNIFNNLDNGIVIDPKERLANPKNYTNVCNTSNTYYKYETCITKQLLNTQQNNNLYIVFDNCLFNNQHIYSDENFIELLFNHKHYKLLTVLTFQNLQIFEPTIFDAFEFIFLSFEDIIYQKKKLYYYFCGMIPSYEIFDTIFKELTKDYGFMVIDNRNRNVPITEKIFWYRVDLEQLNIPYIISNNNLLNIIPNNARINYSRITKSKTDYLEDIYNGVLYNSADIEFIKENILNINNKIININNNNFNNNNFNNNINTELIVNSFNDFNTELIMNDIESSDDELSDDEL